MIVPGLVLGAFLLSMLGIIAALVVRQRERVTGRESALGASTIDTAAGLDAALAIQRSLRIDELQRRVADKSRLPYALVGLALILQLAAMAADHLAHPSIAVMSVTPACVVLTADAARRRRAQRELYAYLRNRAT